MMHQSPFISHFVLRKDVLRDSHSRQAQIHRLLLDIAVCLLLCQASILDQQAFCPINHTDFRELLLQLRLFGADLQQTAS